MGRCNCSGGPSTLIVEGPGIRVVGSGANGNPYVITADTADLAAVVQVNETATIDLDVVGAGTPGDPLIFSGNVHMSLNDLTDVTDPLPPALGDVPVFTTTGWQFQPPPTVAPGTLSVLSGGGLRGDGSGASPLAAATSGIWGVNVGGTSTDSTTGQPIYVDSAGQLRAAPLTAASEVPWSSITGAPTIFPSDWSSVTRKPTTFPPSTHTHDDRYWTMGQADARYAAIAPGGSFMGRAVLDVTGANRMGLRWNGGHIVGRVDNSEWEMATIPDVNSAVAGAASAANTAQSGVNYLGATKANAFGDVETTRYTRGPDGTAYNRSMQGAGWFSVWMDNSLQFGRNTSSIRFKEDVTPHDYDPAAVLALQPVTYHRIGSEIDREFGMIAEEVHKHVPEIVTWFAEPGTDDEPKIDGIRYDLLAVAQQSVIRAHEARITALEQKLEELDWDTITWRR